MYACAYIYICTYIHVYTVPLAPKETQEKPHFLFRGELLVEVAALTWQQQWQVRHLVGCIHAAEECWGVGCPVVV